MANNNSVEYNGDNTAVDVLKWAIEKYHPAITVSCSFEQPVTAHMALTINPDVKIFSIDTGRLPEETYECAEKFQKRFNANIEWYFPKKEEVEKLVNEKGMYSFRESLNARKECCGIRKVEPLNRALQGMKAWVTGRRKDQNITRNELPKIEYDYEYGGLLKINPLADWTADDVHDYIKQHNVPENKLLKEGYTSVGCACCTRAVQPGEDPRSGRWWWEQAEHKECGLHPRNWQI